MGTLLTGLVVKVARNILTRKYLVLLHGVFLPVHFFSLENINKWRVYSGENALDSILFSLTTIAVETALSIEAAAFFNLWHCCCILGTPVVFMTLLLFHIYYDCWCVIFMDPIAAFFMVAKIFRYCPESTLLEYLHTRRHWSKGLFSHIV